MQDQCSRLSPLNDSECFSKSESFRQMLEGEATSRLLATDPPV